MNEFSGSEDSEAGDAGDLQWNARGDALDEPEIGVGLESDPMRLPSLETMAMPGMRISHARNTNTKHARRELELTKHILASMRHAESADEEKCVGIEPALPDLHAILADRVASSNSEQRRICQSIRADLVGGACSKRVVLIGPEGTGKSYLMDTIGLMLELLSNTRTGEHASTVRWRHSLLVKTAYTGVPAANVGGMRLHNALEVKGISFVSAVPDSSLTRLQHDWLDVSVFVIDETSSLSLEILYEISARLGSIYPDKSIFVLLDYTV